MMSFARESPRNNLRLLWWLRNIAIAGQSAAILLVAWVIRIPLPQENLWLIVGALACVNLLTLLRLRLPRTVSEMEFFGQLLIDIVALALLLYYTGGAANPFTSLFILQVVIASITLPVMLTWLVAFTAIGFYTALMIWKIDLPMLEHHHGGDFFSLHVQGMWVNFVLLALLVGWFATRMSATIRRQDMLLAEAEQMAALGMLAANAAHELGTPLATIAVLAGDYKDEAQDDPQTRRAATLAGEVGRCKSILSRITASAGLMRAEAGAPMGLDDFLRRLCARWQEQRPAARLETLLEGTQPAPRIVAEYGLEQALVNLLNNAADASAQPVRLTARWSRHALTLAVRDHGGGIPQHVLASLGKPVATSKPDGLGMGLYLSMSVITRLGGALTLENQTEGGALATVQLPLKRLAV